MRSAHTDVRFLICFPRTDPRKTLVGLGGLEPPTSPLSGARSNHLSYRPKDLRSGGADRDRTGDPRVANAVLSQLSYSPSSCGAKSKIIGALWTPWARADLNCRPHAYQACALTT